MAKETTVLNEQVCLWRAKALRRGRMMKMLETYLATLISNAKRPGVTKEEAQTLFDLALEFTKSIHAEIKDDRALYDGTENRKWRPSKRRRDTRNDNASSSDPAASGAETPDTSPFTDRSGMYSS